MVASSDNELASIKRYLRDYAQNVYVPEGAKNAPLMMLKRIITAGLTPLERRKAKGFAKNSAPLRLHLGAGTIYLDGWVNVDLARPGRKQDLNWDLAKPLPFENSSVDAIFSEHTLEHLPYDVGFNLLRECARVLRRGGIFRISVPGLEIHMLDYQSANPNEGSNNGLPTRCLIFNRLFFHHGHRAIYDCETLSLLLRAAGFSMVCESKFGGGSLGKGLDLEVRKHESLYIEAER